MKRKRCLRELTIKDNFMFGAVMMDENNCKGSREMEERFMIFEEMLKEERAAGFAKGRAEGVAEGRISESKDTLLLFLQNLGTVPKVLSDQIEEQGDLDVLKEWIRMAFQSKSVEEFAKKIK